MKTRQQLDDVPYDDKIWLEPLPKHLHAAALAVQDFFELPAARHRGHTRSEIRRWLSDMRNRAFLVEQYSRLRLGHPLQAEFWKYKVPVDAALDLPGLVTKSHRR
jgi:hypothetical protein